MTVKVSAKATPASFCSQVIVALWLVSTLLFAPLLWVLQTQPVDLGGQLAEAVETNGLKFCVENWTGPGFSKKVYGKRTSGLAGPSACRLRTTVEPRWLKP